MPLCVDFMLFVFLIRSFFIFLKNNVWFCTKGHYFDTQRKVLFYTYTIVFYLGIIFYGEKDIG